MEITEVRVRLLGREGKLRGFASITLDDCFVVRDIRIIDSMDGLFVSMPHKRRRDGTWVDVAHPIDSATRERIENRILDEYERQLDLVELGPDALDAAGGGGRK